jgi:hypothetical protein
MLKSEASEREKLSLPTLSRTVFGLRLGVVDVFILIRIFSALADEENISTHRLGVSSWSSAPGREWEENPLKFIKIYYSSFFMALLEALAEVEAASIWIKKGQREKIFCFYN